MRVIAHPIDVPAALVFQDDNAVLFIKRGLVPQNVVSFLDRLLSVIRIK